MALKEKIKEYVYTTKPEKQLLQYAADVDKGSLRPRHEKRFAYNAHRFAYEKYETIDQALEVLTQRRQSSQEQQLTRAAQLREELESRSLDYAALGRNALRVAGQAVALGTSTFLALGGLRWEIDIELEKHYKTKPSN